MQFTVRTATHDDIPALQRLIADSVNGLQANDYTAAQRDGALGHALGLDTQLVVDGTYFVATPIDDPDTIVASGGWSYRRTLFGSDDGPNRVSLPLDPAVDAAKVRAIFVHPAWARRGLGSLLLEHCENAARAAGFKRFEMGSTLTGVPLYVQRGYVAQNDISIPLPNGEILKVIHMTKEA